MPVPVRTAKSLNELERRQALRMILNDARLAFRLLANFISSPESRTQTTESQTLDIDNGAPRVDGG